MQIAAFIDWSFDLNIDDEGALVQVDQLLKDNFNPKFGWIIMISVKIFIDTIKITLKWQFLKKLKKRQREHESHFTPSFCCFEKPFLIQIIMRKRIR